MRFVEVTARILNFRAGPGTGYRIIDGLRQGTILTVYGSRGDWLSVADPADVRGWVHGAYVKDYTWTVEVTARVLNLRAGPGTDHRIIRGLLAGTILKVFYKSGDWLEIEDATGQKGWVHGNWTKPYPGEEPLILINPIQWWIEKEGWRVTSPYGPRTGRYAGFHRGVDMGGNPCGHPIRFPFDGKVVAAQTSGMGTWGNTVCVELSPDFVTLNAHLQSIRVRTGQAIKQGDIIGLNGGTNHSGANYACHIHFEVLNNNGSRPWRGTIWGDPAKFKFGVRS